MYAANIDKNEAGQRFDKYLKKLLKNAPDSFLYKMLRKKNITLNGKKADGKEILKLADEVKIFFSDETFEKFSGFLPAPPSDNMQSHVNFLEEQSEINVVNESELQEYLKAFQTFGDLEIVYEDEHILIINKPAGILTQKANINDLSLNEWMIGYLLHHNVITPETFRTFKPSICNRLDRNTSGMVICGKTLPGIQRMNAMIKDRSLHKYYQCIVFGLLPEKEGHLQGYLYKKQAHNTVEVYKTFDEVPEEWKDKVAFIDTKYQVIRSNHNLSLLEVELITGKTHQIRAHLSSIGHPLVGDGKYCNKTTARLSKEYKVKGQLLHAYKLEFPFIEGELQALSQKTIYCTLPALFDKILL